MTLRRTTNCPSARVTGLLRLKVSLRIGGPVVTSRVMLGCSQVRVSFSATTFQVLKTCNATDESVYSVLCRSPAVRYYIAKGIECVVSQFVLHARSLFFCLISVQPPLIALCSPSSLHPRIASTLGKPG